MSLSQAALRRVWSWHFAAGLLSVPLAIVLAVSGAVYSFVPQWDAHVERQMARKAVPTGEWLAMDALQAAAMQRHPDAQLKRLILPRSADDPTVEFELTTPQGARTLWLDRRSAAVIHDAATDWRLMAVSKRLHGTLLAGKPGALLVEAMASWMIILIITGLVLWWPRSAPWWHLFWPKLQGLGGKREFWRRLHGAVGAWASLLILTLLVSGLPWTSVWGSGLDKLQSAAGWTGPGQEWFVTLQSGEPSAAPMSLDAITQRAMAEDFLPPVHLMPPRGDNGVWTVRSMVQNRQFRQTLHLDRWSGEPVMRIRFADYHPFQRVVSTGIALHEGALFGWLNQLLGVLAALAVVGLAASGTWIWWQRRPRGSVAIPKRLPHRFSVPASAGLLVGLVLLPMAAASLLAVMLIAGLWTQVAARLPGRKVVVP